MQRVEDALELAVAQEVPRVEVEIDGRDVVVAREQSLGDLLAGAQRYLALGRLASAQDSDPHQRPTISTSGSSCAPKRRLTSAMTRSISRRTSAAVAPPSLTMKLPWSGDTTALPSRAP